MNLVKSSKPYSMDISQKRLKPSSQTFDSEKNLLVKSYLKVAKDNDYRFPIDKRRNFPMAYIPMFLEFTQYDLDNGIKKYVKVAKTLMNKFRQEKFNSETIIEINNIVHTQLEYKSDNIESYHDYLIGTKFYFTQKSYFVS